MFRNRAELSLVRKLEIKLQPPDCSTRRRSGIFGVPKSTIARIRLQEQAPGHVTTRKRKREGEHSDVDEALTQWNSLHCMYLCDIYCIIHTYVFLFVLKIIILILYLNHICITYLLRNKNILLYVLIGVLPLGHFPAHVS